MPSTTGIRRRLSPALLAGAPYRIGDRMAERYQVKDAVGVGPLGYVFRATDEQQGIDVAVKMIHPRFVQTAEEREAFARAVEPARRFHQPSLARLHDVGVEQGWPYVTYSFLDGLTLRRMIDSRLAKGQTFTLEEVEPFLGQLAAALEAAHPLGGHADLKPENVIILPDMLRVVDWGLARGLPRLPFVQAQRRTGTHRYLAPELVAGADADPRADLYALGVLVGEMLTGLTPDDDIPELRLTAPELPEAVEGFYRRALNERPEARFRSARELYEEFLALLSPQPAAVPAGAPAAVAEAEIIEEVEPLADEEAEAAPAAGEPGPALASDPTAPAERVAGSPEPTGSAPPIAAAALPRFEDAPQARHASREVVALEPPQWTAASPAAESAHPAEEVPRWRSLRLWDAGEGSEEDPASAAAPEALAPASPAEADALAHPGPLQPSDEEADHAVAGLVESGGPDGATDEPLLAEALGVDLMVEGDEPVSAPPAEAGLAAPPPPEPPAREAPRIAALADTVRREPPPVAEPSRPWATGPRPAPFRRDPPEPPRLREGAVLHPRPSSPVAPAAALAEAPAAPSRATLPPPPAIPPLLSAVPRAEPVAEAPGPVVPVAAPTPLTLVPEPSPTRQEPVVVRPGAPDPGQGTGAGRGAGSWSPAELLAQVIAEIQADERGSGGIQPTAWEPVPLDATQPISSDEVAARVAAIESPRPASTATPLSTPEVDVDDLPALRHQAGRAGMRMALFVAAGLIVGMLGGWTALRVLVRPPRPEVQRLTQAPAAEQPPPPRD